MKKKDFIEWKAHFDRGYSLVNYPLGIITGLGAGVAGLATYGVRLSIWLIVLIAVILISSSFAVGWFWNNQGWLDEEHEFHNRRNPAIRKLLDRRS